MRRAALAAAFLGLLGTGLGCRAVFGRCDCLNDPSCQPLPPYNNPSQVVGPTMTGACFGAGVCAAGVCGPNGAAIPVIPSPVPYPEVATPTPPPAGPGGPPTPMPMPPVPSAGTGQPMPTPGATVPPMKEPMKEPMKDAPK